MEYPSKKRIDNASSIYGVRDSFRSFRQHIKKVRRTIVLGERSQERESAIPVQKVQPKVLTREEI